MKKKLILFTAALAIAGSSQAQSQSLANHFKPGTLWYKMLQTGRPQSAKLQFKERPNGSPRASVMASSKYEMGAGAWEELDSMRYYWNASNGLGVNIVDHYNDFFEYIPEYQIGAFMDKMFNEPPANFNFDFYTMKLKKAPLMDSLGFYYDGDLEFTAQFVHDGTKVNNVDIDSDLITYEYDANGNIILQTEGGQTNWDKDSLVYNSANQLEGFYRFSNYNTEFYSNTYVYDANGALVARTYKELSGSTVNNHQIDSIFSLAPNQDSIVSYYLNNGILESDYYTKTFSTNNKVDSVIFGDRNSNEEQIIHFFRNANGDVTDAYGFSNGDTTVRYVLNYDGAYYTGGHVSVYENNEWQNFARTNFTYDTSKNLTQVSSYENYDPILGRWVAESGDILLNLYYQWEEEPNATKKINPLAMELFPNPAQSLLQIKLADEQIALAVVYDAAGRVVMQKRYAQKDFAVALDISHLIPGTYLLQVNGNKGTSTFVKQ